MPTSPPKSYRDMIHDIIRSAKIKLKINKDGLELTADTAIGIIAAIVIVALFVWGAWPSSEKTPVIREKPTPISVAWSSPVGPARD